MGADPTHRTEPSEPGRVAAGRTLGALLAYHVLILAGGALTIEGILGGSPDLRDFGLAVLGAGIVTVVLVLVGSGRRALAAARAAQRSGALERPVSAVRSWTCPRCAARGTGPTVTCPRCGALVAGTGAPTAGGPAPAPVRLSR